MNTIGAKYPNRDSANNSEQIENIAGEIPTISILNIDDIISGLPIVPTGDADDDKTYTVILDQYTINQERIDLLEIEKNASTKKEKNTAYQKARSMGRYKHKTDAFLVEGYKKAKEFCDNNEGYFFIEGNVIFKDDNGIIGRINFDEKITRPPRYDTVTQLQTGYEFISNICR